MGDVSFLAYSVGDMGGEQDGTVGCGCFRVFGDPYSVIIQYHILVDVEIVAV